jgi:indole-3-glycerol phosphate synthase
MRDHLDEIVRYKRAHRVPPAADLERRVANAPEPRSLLRSLGTYRTVVIAECKKASPSRGVLAERYDPAALAQAYEESGAAAVSVLTDEAFFQGSLTDLVVVREAVDLPVLRKDFTLDKMDLLEARAHGADLVLLIARILADAELDRLLAVTRELGMEAIVEVHDQNEVYRALVAGAELVGINNRDLGTFSTDLAVTERLLSVIPSQIAVVSESGIESGEDVARLREAGARGVLVGEALIRAPDPGALLRELVDAGCPDCWRERVAEQVEAPASRVGFQPSAAANDSVTESARA